MWRPTDSHLGVHMTNAEIFATFDRAARSSSPLSTTFELLATRQVTGAIRAAVAEIGKRQPRRPVVEALMRIVDEVEDLETLLDALPDDHDDGGASQAEARLPAAGHFGGSL